ncbi:MAG: hypothetical protein L0227_03900 [Chloroflexi bacterium]|nr:hypothetical protein [Chloroflexota bacterium]
MLYLTNPAEDRIRDLQAAAADLRTERILAGRRATEASPGLRIRIGTALMTAGAALVTSAGAAPPSRASR